MSQDCTLPCTAHLVMPIKDARSNIQLLWECMQVRHGAALTLREVLRSQADAAGLVAPVAAHPTGSH